MGSDLLFEKRILIVDDEPDVLDTLEDLLEMSVIERAESFDEARHLLESRPFDIAILDIMGVDGFKLLEIATKEKVLPVMLTGHALTPQNIVKSYQEGAASYIPKDEISKIAAFLSDIVEAKAKGKHFWWRWFDRLGTYLENKFGPDWQEKDKEFWERFGHWE
ncbi:MAG: response regulator [Desulfatiglandales bacterium]